MGEKKKKSVFYYIAAFLIAILMLVSGKEKGERRKTKNAKTKTKVLL